MGHSIDLKRETGSLLPGSVSQIIRQWDGALTQDLLLTPGKFGLGKVPDRQQPTSTTPMVCGFCSTGCSLNIHLQDGEAVNLTPTTDYPVNLGMACPKGWEALTVLKAPDRGVTPLIRDKRGGSKREIGWNEGVAEMCNRFREIGAKHGPESVAFLSTGQIPTEEMVFLGALAKFGMGMVHGDGNTRQCMATAAVAYKQSFGFDAPPYTYQDFEESDVIVLVGSNICIAHPIMWQRVMRNPNQPEIVVIDPRKTETAMAATQHLAIRPKGDLALLYGIANILIEHDWIDADYIASHTDGFEDFREFVQAFTPEVVAEKCGIDAGQLQKLAETIHQGKRVSFWWTMGVNQSYEGVRTAQAIINLALITGNIGRPGTGANSITGQCNAMGSRIFSNTTNLFGGRDFTNEADRHEVAAILDIPESCIPRENSWAYDQIMEGILAGKIKGLWVVCTNTAHSWINQNAARDILSRLDYLVVQDMYSTTETAEMADLYLPAAGWGEKEGTFINSERRLGLLKKVARAPGKALADFSIFRLVASHWGCDELFEKWREPADVFESMKQLSAGRPCDITGIVDYQMLDENRGIQWPLPADKTDFDSQRRLFEDGNFYTANSRAKLLFDTPKPLKEAPNEHYPILLLTGRGTASQWHTQTRTSKSAVLRQLYPAEIYVEINPLDARALGIRPNQNVIIESQRGSIRANAFVTPTVQVGQAFLPMHYEQTNQLTLAHFDPHSRQPSYKNCAVRIRLPASHE